MSANNEEQGHALALFKIKELYDEQDSRVAVNDWTGNDRRL
jgi:hypothetical protein